MVSGLAQGLVRYWPLDGNLLDLSSTHDNATVGAGSVTYGLDLVNRNARAAVLDGSTYLRGTDTLLPTGTSPKSFALWAYPISAPVNPNWNVFFKYGKYASTNMFSGGIDNTGKWAVSQYGLGLTGGTATLNAWTHFAVTYDGSNYHIYENGANTQNGAMTTNVILDKLYIGSDDGGTLYTARLCNLGFWNRCLSASEVQELFMVGFSSKPLNTGIFDSIHTYLDFAGDSLDVTNTNTSTESGTLTKVADNTGRVSGAYNFDGGASYITMSAIPTTASASYTVLAWVNPTARGDGRDACVWDLYSTHAQFFKDDAGYICNNGRIYFQHYGADVDGTIGEIPFGSWTHVGWRYNTGAATNHHSSTFVNGVEAHYNDNGPMVVNASSFWIGRESISTSANSYQGSLSQFMLWTRALSNDEIAYIYNYTKNRRLYPVVRGVSRIY